MKRPLIIALGIATLVKLVLAAVTIGTNDVATWRAFADHAMLCGRCAYQFPGPYGDPFNHPPFIIHFLKLIGMSSAAWFPFWIRLPAILAGYRYGAGCYQTDTGNFETLDRVACS
jgi:hypothetical protein